MRVNNFLTLETSQLWPFSPSHRSSEGIFARVNSRENLRFRRGGKITPHDTNNANSSVNNGVVDGESAAAAAEGVAIATTATSGQPQLVNMEENEGKIFARKRFEAKGNVSIGMTQKEKNWRKNPKWQVYTNGTANTNVFVFLFFCFF